MGGLEGHPYTTPGATCNVCGNFQDAVTCYFHCMEGCTWDCCVTCAETTAGRHHHRLRMVGGEFAIEKNHPHALTPHPLTAANPRTYHCAICTKRISDINYHCYVCGTYDNCADCFVKYKQIEDTTPDTLVLKPYLPTDKSYEILSYMFMKSWINPTLSQPRILKILKLANITLQNSFEAHLSRLNSQETLVLFHGMASVCTDVECSQCALCSISRKGFKISHSGSSFNRFGRGIYFAKNACKSHGYTGKAAERCIIVAKVAIGITKDVELDEPTLTVAPSGYDSIHGIPGARLNYEEFVVYEDAQALPMAAIIYEVDK